MIESDYDKKLKKFLIPMLRRKSLWWTCRNEAKAKARVSPGQYKCAGCDNIFHNSQVNMDHRSPVINVRTSWVSWDHYIKSLLCDIDNWNCLCITCHASKTAVENEQRKMNKKKKSKKKVK